MRWWLRELVPPSSPLTSLAPPAGRRVPGRLGAGVDLMAWRNQTSGVIHAHANMTNAPNGWTACRRVQLWEAKTLLRDDFEMYWPKDDVDRAAECRHCREAIEGRIEWLQSWVNP